MNSTKVEHDNTVKDINDIFDDILLSEEHLVKENYNKGFALGASEFNVEAYHLGYHRGAQLGAEIGYYSAFVRSYANFLENKTVNDRTTKTIHDLIELIRSFPQQNDPTVDILDSINLIRGKFKKLCALLKIDAAFPESNRLSF